MARHRRPAADSLESRLEFETLIANLSSRFVNLPPGEVDREITDSLRQELHGKPHGACCTTGASFSVKRSPHPCAIARGGGAERSSGI